MVKKKKAVSPSSEEEQQQYVVEVITKARVDDEGEWEYFVKWAGYESENNTWEPHDNVQQCDRLLNGFWNDVGYDDDDYPIGYSVHATPTWIGKEKAFFAKTFGRSNQVPSDAEGSSDGGPIPRIEQLPRRKKDVKTKGVKKPYMGKIKRPRSHTPTSPPAKKTKIRKVTTKKRSLGSSGGAQSESDGSASSDIPLTALKKKPKKRPFSEREPSEEIMVNPARKKARITSVGKKGKEKADTFTEHEESDHAGSLFSGSDGRSSPDVSLATKDSPRAKQDIPAVSRQRSTSTAGSSRATLTNQPSKLSAPNQGPSGITTKQRLAQTAKAIVPASRPTLQRSNLSKLSFKKNAANTGSKPNTPVQEAHPSTSVFNEHTTASPMTIEDPPPFFQPSVQPAAPESRVAVPLPRRTAPPPPPAAPVNSFTEVDQFLSTVMPAELAAPMDETAVSTQIRKPGPTGSTVTKPTPSIGRIPKKWKWTGEAFIDVEEGKAHRLCNVSLYDMTEALPTGLRFSVCLSAADSIRLGKLHEVPELYMILRSTVQVHQFIKVGPSEDADAEVVNTLAAHLRARRSFTYARLSVDGVEAALMLVFPPSINELCRLLRVPDALLVVPTAPMIAALVPWELSSQEYDDARWFKLRSDETAHTRLDPKVADLANETFANNSAVQRALRILNVPMSLYKFLAYQSRTYSIWYSGGDGCEDVVGVETTALRTVLSAFKAKDMGHKADVRAIFVHVGALKTLHKLVALAERRSKRQEIRFYTYGTHESVAPERWGIREIYPLGGIVTFTPAAILNSVVGTLELIKKIDEHPLWECYVLPSVIAMLAKMTCQDQSPLSLFDKGEFFFSDLLEQIAEGRVALLRAPPLGQGTRGAKDLAAEWVSWQLELLRMDARELLAASITLAAEKYSTTQPHALPEAIQKEIVRDMLSMQRQPAIMDGYRRFVVIKSKGDMCLGEDKDGIEYTTVSGFDFKDDWFKK